MLLLVLFLTVKYVLIKTDCGFPPLPESTKINLFKKRYEEHTYIQYECDSDNKELIGDNTIHCMNGRWDGITPKCAKESAVKLQQLMITDVLTHKPYSVTLGSNVRECWKPDFSWNISMSQKWAITVKTNARIDYFSLILFGKELIRSYNEGDISIDASVHSPHKHCTIDKFDLFDNHLMTRIDFICYKTSEDLFLPSDKGFHTDYVKIISLDVKLKGDPMSVTFCNIKTYSISDSCGSPERPLHSHELTKEKSFTVFSCEDDFYLEPINNQKVYCHQLGNWDKPFPICVAKTYCRLPAFDRIDPFMHIDYKDLNYLNGTPYAETNSIAIYSCHNSNHTEYVLKGDSQRICKHGFWSGSQPKCVSVYRSKGKGYHFNHNHVTETHANNHTIPGQLPWSKLNVIIISMLASFIIGAVFIGLLIHLIMKYVVKKRRIEMPSVIVNEPNDYYERNFYEAYSGYESVNLNHLGTERVNSLYDPLEH